MLDGETWILSLLMSVSAGKDWRQKEKGVVGDKMDR